MHPLLQNRFVRFAGLGLAGLFVLFVVSSILLASMGSSRSMGLDSVTFSSASDQGYDGFSNQRVTQAESDFAGPNMPTLTIPPNTNSGYTANLEAYETTDYNINGRVKNFDEVCTVLANLKTDARYDFRSLNESLNNCRAVFFTADDEADKVADQLAQFSGVTVSKNVQSVTRHRQQLQSQIDVLKQQLASVSRTLTESESSLNEIIGFAREAKDASALSEAVQIKLNLINNLTQNKIRLTAQLDTQYQQAADLNERIGISQFSVSINRSYSLNPEQTSRKWESAWRELSNTYTNTLIGITAFFGVFLLWTLRLTLYLVVLIVVVRGIWKLVKFLWNK